VAESESQIAGFVTFDPNGHLDCLYVLRYFQRQGVAAALCRRMEHEWLARGVRRVFTEASITARPFFESVGFRVIALQAIECRGILLRNYQMEKFSDEIRG